MTRQRTDEERGLGYTFSAALASALAAPWWAMALTVSATSGPWAPLGLTTAALLVTWTADWLYDLWPLRALAFVPLTALTASPPALHAVLAFTTGAAS